MKKIAFAFAAVTAMIAVPAFAQDSTGGGETSSTTTTATASTTAAPASGGGGGSGLELGLRLGYGLPMGDAVKDAKLGDSIKGKIPIWVDVGYRVNPNIYVGAYFAYGIAMVNKDKIQACSAGADCSASTIDLGVMAAYHIMPDQSFDPWVGLGVGYEIGKVSFSAGGLSSSQSFSGLTFANLQVGGDYKVNNNLGIGPFVSFALGQYSSCSVDNGSCTIQDKAMHEWLTIGVRGTYGIW